MTEQPEDMRFSALVETFCFSLEKALHTCSSSRPVSQPLLPGCAPRPFLLPCGHPFSDRCFNIDSLALYWRQWASAIVLRKRHFSTGKKRTKKTKTGARVVWTVLHIYLTCQGGERMWERATQRLFVRLEHLGPKPGQQGGKRAGRRWYLLSLWVDWIEKTNCNAKGCSFQDSAGMGWERTEKVGWRKPFSEEHLKSTLKWNIFGLLILMFFQSLLWKPNESGWFILSNSQ